MITTVQDSFYPTDRNAWRQWLMEHHANKQSVWLIYYKKSACQPTVSWSEAVDEALCFGWVDSRKKPIDAEKFMQFFSKRKAVSTWSKINKQKVEQLAAQGLMMQAGYDAIEIAKTNGSWDILNEVEELEIPKDLNKEFKAHKGAKDYFLSLSKSTQKSILQWIILAKRPDTRLKRIGEVVLLAAQKQKPKQF